MQILKAELKSWMLGEFASLKSKHDGGVADAVRQSFLHCYCEPKARQSFSQLTSNRLPRRYAPRNDDVVASNRLPRRYAPRNDLGRSMIEMLGVLAIIAVLSIGGIAGYSKAMERWKISRQKEYLAQLFLQCVNLKDIFFRECKQDGKSVYTAAIMEAMQVIPDGLTKINNLTFEDFAGNQLDVLMWYNTWSAPSGKLYHAYEYNIKFVLSKKDSSDRLRQQYCVTFFEQAQAISSYVDEISNFMANNSYYGFSTNKIKNIAAATPNDIYNFCQKCNSDKGCTINLFFKL